MQVKNGKITIFRDQGIFGERLELSSWLNCLHYVQQHIYLAVLCIVSGLLQMVWPLFLTMMFGNQEERSTILPSTKGIINCSSSSRTLIWHIDNFGKLENP